MGEFKLETMEEIKKEAERLMELFPVYDWDERTGYEQNMKLTKQYAIICLDEKIITSQLLNHDNYFREYNSFLHSVKQYIKDNY